MKRAIFLWFFVLAQIDCAAESCPDSILSITSTLPCINGLGTYSTGGSSCSREVIAGTNTCAETVTIGDSNPIEAGPGAAFQYLPLETAVDDRDGKRYITVPLRVGGDQTIDGTIELVYQ